MGADSLDAIDQDEIPAVSESDEYPDQLAFAERLAADYESMAVYRVGDELTYQVHGPELVEQVLVRENENFRRGEQTDAMLGPVMGDGVLLQEGEQWREQRHRLDPSFGPDALASHAPMMVESTERLIAGWEDGDVIVFRDEMVKLTAGIIARAMFDVDLSDRLEEMGEALSAVLSESQRRVEFHAAGLDWESTAGKERFDEGMDTLWSMAEDIVDANEPGDGNMVERLLAAAEGTDHVDEELVRDEVVTMLIAGHETTALTLTFTAFLLANNPDRAARLHDEVDEVLGDRPPTGEDIDDLDRVRNAVRESMRLYPPAAFVSREATEPVTIGGFEIPEGGTVMLPQWVVHRDSRHYDEPGSFRPERWSDDEFVDALPNFAYFPFGGGPRRCLGDRFSQLEAHLALARIAQDWAFETEQESVGVAPMLTLRPTETIEIELRRRD